VLLLAASLMAGTAVLAQAVVDTAVDTHISAHPQAPVTQQAEILNTAKTPPFYINEDSESMKCAPEIPLSRSETHAHVK